MDLLVAYRMGFYEHLSLFNTDVLLLFDDVNRKHDLQCHARSLKIPWTAIHRASTTKRFIK